MPHISRPKGLQSGIKRDQAQKRQTTGTQITFGVIDKSHPLTITSHMADNGVILSDGIEADYLAFNSGATATI